MPVVASLNQSSGIHPHRRFCSLSKPSAWPSKSATLVAKSPSLEGESDEGNIRAQHASVSGATLMHVDRILGRDTRGPGTRYRGSTIVYRGREHRLMRRNQKAIMFLPSELGIS